MIKDADKKFLEIIKTTEVRKIDFKRDQYNLADENSKSKFVKDILCIANAAGGDGYIIVGVKAEKGKPREIIGVSHHYDSSDLEQIVNSVIEEPIQFEYYSLQYQGRDCGLIYVPDSIARPHWPHKDYGVLKKHVFYTRRASGNREASIQEIRQMCIETVRVSDIADRKIKTSRHVVDELATLSMGERESAMYRMLKSITRDIGLKNYRSVISKFLSKSSLEFVIVNSQSTKAVCEYGIFMYPWTVKAENIIWSRDKLSMWITGSSSRKAPRSIKERLKKSALVHVAYKNINTKALERRPYSPVGYWFANELKESWGKVMKWEDRSPILIGNKMAYKNKSKYEFFIPAVSSKEELKERLEHLLAWVENNIK